MTNGPIADVLLAFAATDKSKGARPVKILVPFKSVPDPYAGPGGAAKSVINPFDEIAIEEALRMRERGDATEITGVTIGVAAVDEQIRSALAMGIDRALRIEDARALAPYAIARILCALVKKDGPQVVMMASRRSMTIPTRSGKCSRDC